MRNNSFYSFTQKLFVCFYSDPNFFSLNILENLLSKNCVVNIVTKDINAWKKITYHLDKTKFGITPTGENFVKEKYNYAIYSGGFLDKTKAYKDFQDFLQDIAIAGVKSLAIFPFEAFDQELDEKMLPSDNFGVLYMGDIVGPRIDLESNLLVAQTINDILYKRTLSVEIGEVYYPIFVADAAKTVCKWLLSFGPYGKTVFCLGNQVSSTTLWKESKKLIPDLTLNYDSSLQVRPLPKSHEIKTIHSDLSFTLQETYYWVANTWQEEKPKPKAKVKKIVIKKKRIRKPIPKFVRPLVFLTLTILILPFLTMGASFGILYFNYRNFTQGKSFDVENSFLFAKTLFVISKTESSFLAAIPLLNVVYRETYYVSWLGENLSGSVVDFIPLTQTTSGFLAKVLGNELFDPSPDSQEIKTALDILYKEVSIIQLETTSSAQKGSRVAQKVLYKVDFDRLKTLSSKGMVLADKLPDLLGKDKKQSYLVLFQNNMELRPTGGFIGSFGVTNFESGRLTELTVSDVYSADGQLKGHVEPPAPIKDYLGEANWWLRDSNWDPDFPTSAQRAEWFLDKETDRQVDGVIGVDLGLVKDILKYTGPIFLPDFNLDITEQNLYEKTQSEVQDNFFPGTHKKASFLTALSRSLLAEVTKMDNHKKLSVLRAIFENLEGRHVQVYVHDKEAELAVSEIGWGGVMGKFNCGDNCQSDFVGLVEANVGVNKANYFIKRSVNLDINLEGNTVTKNLVIDVNNSANPALGLAGKYKVYMRLLVPDASNFVSAKRIVGVNEQILGTEISTVRDRKEVGIITEILGGQSQKIKFTWESWLDPDKAPDSYGLFIRKQAGVTDDPWVVNVGSPEGAFGGNLLFALTDRGVYTYTMNLKHDFVTIFPLKHE